jgi:phosphoglycolate phosphatase-like HAD superfamily hydrolase
MAVVSKDIVVKALNELSEDQIGEVLDFIGYLQWRSRDTEDQLWFWTEEWQERYREAKEDLAQGRYKEFEDVEDLLQELKS